MTAPSEVQPKPSEEEEAKSLAQVREELGWDEAPDDVEMSLFDHLEELRWRIFYAAISVLGGIIICFAFVKPLVQFLEGPANGVTFLQLSPGEYFFVSLKVAAYSGMVIASPLVLYQIMHKLFFLL